MRISWLKFEPKVSNFPIVTKTLPSVSVTQAKKEIFFVFFILLRSRHFVAKVIGTVLAFISQRRIYDKGRIFINETFRSI